MTKFRKISRNVDFVQKMALFGPFLPPERGQNLGPKIFLQESQTKRPYASKKPSYIKIRPFFGKKWSKTLQCHHMQCIFDQKGPKRPKPDFSRDFHLFFFSKVNPKYSSNLQN